MENIGWLEDFLKPLEEKAQEALERQRIRFKKGKPILVREDAIGLLKDAKRLKELVVEHKVPRDAIYALTWILGRSYEMNWLKTRDMINKCKKARESGKASGTARRHIGFEHHREMRPSIDQWAGDIHKKHPSYTNWRVAGEIFEKLKPGFIEDKTIDKKTIANYIRSIIPPQKRQK